MCFINLTNLFQPNRSRPAPSLFISGMASSSNDVMRRARPTRYTGEGSNQQPVEQPVQQPLEQPMQQPVEQPVDQQAVMPAQAPNVPRGPNQILDALVLPEEKPVVWPVGPREFDSLPRVSKIASTISKLALHNTPGPYPTLNGWSQDGKDNLLLDFLDRFKWRENEDQGVCRQVLEAIAARGYSSALRRVREKYTRRFGSDTQKWKSKIPLWCKKPHYWTGLCDIWGSQRWLKLSAKNKLNRVSSGRLGNHFAGSKSAYRHSLYLKEKLHREPTYEELYLHIKVAREKRRAKGKAKVVSPDDEEESQVTRSEDNSEVTHALQFADDKSREVYERAQQLKADPANADKSEAEIWIMASGGPNRGRIYGFGSKIDRSSLQTTNNRSRTVYPLEDTRAERRVYTAQEVEVLLEDRDRRYREEAAQREKLEEERSKRYDNLFAQLFAGQGRTMPMFQGPNASAHDLQGMLQPTGAQVPIQTNFQGLLQASGGQAAIPNNFQGITQASGSQTPIQNNFQALMQAAIGSQAQGQNNFQAIQQGFNAWFSDPGANGGMFFGNQ